MRPACQTFDVRLTADLLSRREQCLLGNGLCCHSVVRRRCLVDGGLVGRLLLILGLVQCPARVAQAEQNFLGSEEDVHHRYHPVAHPQGLVLFSTWHGVQDLAGPLTQNSRNPVGSSEVQVLKLEEEVVDCMHDSIELAQAPPAPQVFLA